MRTRHSIAGSKLRNASTLLCALLSAASPLCAQQVAPKSAAQGKPATAEQAKADQHKLPAERGDVIDRIVAIVNGDLVLESDVEEEERFRKLYPYGDEDSGKTERERALTTLIDRTLLLQQEAGFPQVPVTDEQVKADEDDLRKNLPACGSADCVSDAGWQKFLTAAGFTEDELRERIRQRIQVLRFVEQRFRAGIRIRDEEIENFYNKTLLPEYAKNNAQAPPLESISSRIEEILLQQQVSALLDQWLKSLRDAGHVRVLNPTEEAP